MLTSYIDCWHSIRLGHFGPLSFDYHDLIVRFLEDKDATIQKSNVHLTFKLQNLTYK